MARCSGIRAGCCIIVSFARRWAEAAATTAAKVWGNCRGTALLWGVGAVGRDFHRGHMRRAEKPPAGKAAELVAWGAHCSTYWFAAGGGTRPRLCRAGPRASRTIRVCILLVRTDWRLWDIARCLK